MTNTTDTLVALSDAGVDHACRHGLDFTNDFGLFRWSGPRGAVEFEVIDRSRAEAVVRVYDGSGSLVHFHDLNGRMMPGDREVRDATFLDELDDALSTAFRLVR